MVGNMFDIRGKYIEARVAAMVAKVFEVGIFLFHFVVQSVVFFQQIYYYFFPNAINVSYIDPKE